MQARRSRHGQHQDRGERGRRIGVQRAKGGEGQRGDQRQRSADPDDDALGPEREPATPVALPAAGDPSSTRGQRDGGHEGEDGPPRVVLTHEAQGCQDGRRRREQEAGRHPRAQAQAEARRSQADRQTGGRRGAGEQGRIGREPADEQRDQEQAQQGGAGRDRRGRHRSPPAHRQRRADGRRGHRQQVDPHQTRVGGDEEGQDQGGSHQRADPDRGEDRDRIDLGAGGGGLCGRYRPRRRYGPRHRPRPWWLGRLRRSWLGRLRRSWWRRGRRARPRAARVGYRRPGCHPSVGAQPGRHEVGEGALTLFQCLGRRLGLLPQQPRAVAAECESAAFAHRTLQRLAAGGTMMPTAEFGDGLVENAHGRPLSSGRGLA